MPAQARFGPFCVDVDAGTLSRDGEEIPLQPMAFDLLLHLIRNPGTLHSRRDLQKLLWPDVYVADEALSQMIRRVRRALDDSPTEPAYLATVPRRGYRFVGEVGWEDAGAAPPEAAPASAPPPPAPADFFGRDAELESIARHVAAGDRLITLLGAGGMGKTRLALCAASRHPSPGGRAAPFIDLSEARDLEGVIRAAGGALDVPVIDEGEGGAIERLGRALQGRGATLVVVDNFEEVQPLAAQTLGVWRRLAPDATFLVTSRIRLGLAGEVVIPVGPLDPEAGRALFGRRARQAGAGLSGAEDEGRAIDEIVGRLDGSPLAIELAAGRARVMSVLQLQRRLDERFRLLRSQRQDAMSRHRSLAAAIEGSLEGLGEHLTGALVQCSALPGPFGLETAEALMDVGEDPGAPWIPDLLQELVDRSLVHTRPLGEEGGFIVMESIRAYLAPARVQAGPALLLRLRAAVGERLSILLDRGRPNPEIHTLIEAALGAADGDPVWAADVALRVIPWLRERGPRATGRRLLDLALSGRAALPPRAVVALLLGRAQLEPSGSPATLEHIDEALARAHQLSALARRASLDRLDHLIRLGCYAEVIDGLSALRPVPAEDLEATARATVLQAAALTGLGEVEAARAEVESGIRGGRQLSPDTLARLEDQLGLLYSEVGQHRRAASRLRRALELYRRLGWRRREAVILTNLASPLAFGGEGDEAREVLGQALGIFVEIGEPLGQAAVLTNRSLANLLSRDLAAAKADVDAGLALLKVMESWHIHATLLLNQATTRWLAGDLGGAATSCHEALTLALHHGMDGRRQQLLAWLGGIEAGLGELDSAAAHLREARALLADPPRPRAAAATDLLDLHLAAARARAEGDADALAEVRAAVGTRRGETGPQGQILLELLERALDS